MSLVNASDKEKRLEMVSRMLIGGFTWKAIGQCIGLSASSAMNFAREHGCRRPGRRQADLSAILADVGNAKSITSLAEQFKISREHMAKLLGMAGRTCGDNLQPRTESNLVLTTERHLAGAVPLPPGHSATWDAITAGTSLEGTRYPQPVVHTRGERG
jgi:hypothetical protein